MTPAAHGASHLLALAALLAGCAPALNGADTSARPGRPVTVRLEPVRGTTAHGEATLEQTSRHVSVAARFSGLRPSWSYTLFVAMREDCGGTEPGGARTVPLAGALPTLATELPRLVADAAGNATLATRVAGRLTGPGSDFAGRALVLQPDGYGRAACGGVPPG